MLWKKYNGSKANAQIKDAEADSLEIIRQTCDNINLCLVEMEHMREHELLLFLGGYKGLILSGMSIAANEAEEVKNGIYIDKEPGRSMPYGLVKIEVEEC